MVVLPGEREESFRGHSFETATVCRVTGCDVPRGPVGDDARLGGFERVAGIREGVNAVLLGGEDDNSPASDRRLHHAPGRRHAGEREPERVAAGSRPDARGALRRVGLDLDAEHHVFRTEIVVTIPLTGGVSPVCGEAEPVTRNVVVVGRPVVLDGLGRVVGAGGFASSTRRPEDDSVRIRVAERSPREGRRRTHRERIAAERAADTVAAGLFPLAAGLAVVHDEIVVRKLPGDPELQRLVPVVPSVDHGASTQRTPRHRDRVASGIARPGVEDVVDDLVKLEIPYRVRARGIRRFDDNDQIVVVTVVFVSERWIVDTGDRIPGDHLSDVHAAK